MFRLGKKTKLKGPLTSHLSLRIRKRIPCFHEAVLMALAFVRGERLHMVGRQRSTCSRSLMTLAQGALYCLIYRSFANQNLQQISEGEQEA